MKSDANGFYSVLLVDTEHFDSKISIFQWKRHLTFEFFTYSCIHNFKFFCVFTHTLIHTFTQDESKQKFLIKILSVELFFYHTGI